MNKKIKILLVDDQILFIKSLETVLTALCADFEIVGTAYDGREAIKLVKKHRPDIILMDVRMPGMDGVEAAGEILKDHPETRIMMLTTFDDDAYVREALEKGAHGYLLKDVPPEELVSSIRAILYGTVQISPQVIGNLISRNQQKSRQDSLEDKIFSLSRREQELLPLIARGMTNLGMADELCVAEQTIKNHISRIYNKLAIHDRSKLVLALRSITLESLLTTSVAESPGETVPKEY